MAANTGQTAKEKDGEGSHRSRAPISASERVIERLSEDLPVKASLPIRLSRFRTLDSRFPVFHLLFAMPGWIHADQGSEVSKDHQCVAAIGHDPELVP